MVASMYQCDLCYIRARIVQMLAATIREEFVRGPSRQQSILRQMRERISGDLASGALEHGDRLPSVRELGDDLDTDPRVVLGAYEQLVEEGLVEIRPRSGVFVTGGRASAGDALTLPRRWILETMVGAIERDIPFDRLGEHIRITTGVRRLRATVIECNIDQLQSMRTELETYFGLDVATVELDGIVPEAPPRELRDADLLISGGHDREIAHIASTLSKPHIITRVRPALVARLARLLARGPVYFLVIDRRFGAKMRRLVASMPGSENFHALVVDDDDLRVIPSGAPTYVMRSAWARLDGKRHPGRVIAPLRIFAEPTSREILSRILELTSGVDNV